MDQSDEPSEAEVDAVVAEFGGDLRAVIRALLHDLSVLAADFAASVSYGFVRGRTPANSASAERKRTGSD